MEAPNRWARDSSHRIRRTQMRFIMKPAFVWGLAGTKQIGPLVFRQLKLCPVLYRISCHHKPSRPPPLLCQKSMPRYSLGGTYGSLSAVKTPGQNDPVHFKCDREEKIAEVFIMKGGEGEMLLLWGKKVLLSENGFY